MGSRFKDRGLGAIKSDERGPSWVPKRALQAGSAVSTLVTSAKSQGVDQQLQQRHLIRS